MVEQAILVLMNQVLIIIPETRNITLDHITRVDASSAFLGIENVPRVAITMGISTIRKAKRIILLAWGINKAEVVKKSN